MNPKDKVNLYRRLLRQAHARLAALNPTGNEVAKLQQQMEAGEITPEEFESYLEELESRSRSSRSKGCGCSRGAATRTAYHSESELLAAIEASEARFRWLVRQDDYAAADEEKAHLDDLLAQYGDDEYEGHYAGVRTADNFQRDDFQEFFDGYVETALWSSNDESDEYGGEPMDENYTVEDIAPECLEAMRADCQKFFDQNFDVVEAAEFSYGPDFGRWGHVGHDFWLTRNGHGAGFWDGDYTEQAGEILTETSEQFGETDLYISDDGLIYCQ